MNSTTLNALKCYIKQCTAEMKKADNIDMGFWLQSEIKEAERQIRAIAEATNDSKDLIF